MKKLLFSMTLVFLAMVFLLGMQEQKVELKNSQNLYEQGYQLYLQAKDDEAIEYFDKTLAINPSHLLAWCYKARALEILGRRNEALSAIDSALRLDKECTYALWTKSLILQALGRKSEANALLAEVVSRQPKKNDAFSYYGRGIAYSDQNKFDLAIADFNSALKINPQYAAVYRSRGLAYRAQGKYNLAIKDYSSAIKINAKYAVAYHSRGLAYDDQGKYDLAIEEYTSALKINPQYIDAYNDRGNAYYKKGKYDLAIANYNSALKINPQYVYAYCNRGLAYFNQGKYNLAVDDYTSALKLNPKNVKAYMQRGLACSKIGDINSARRDYEEVIELDPTGSLGEKAREELQRLPGSASMQVKKNDEIIQEPKKYIDLGPIKIEHIKTVSEGDYSEIKIKIINASGKDIDSCELTCVLLKDDTEIDFATNYVLSPTEGGLKNGDFLYFDYIFKTSSSEWNKFDFKIKTIEYR